MGRFFKVIGVISIVCLIGVAVAVGSLVMKGSTLDRESRDYVDAAIPAITSAWDKRELVSRAAPELVKKVDAAQLETLFTRFGQLGPLVSFAPPKGEANLFYSTSVSQEVASYVSDATFQNGTARLRIHLCKQDGRWMIRGFFLESIKVSPSRHI